MELRLSKVLNTISCVVLLIAVISCKEDVKPNKKKTTPSKKVEVIKTPAFDADSAYSFVKKQVDFGPRVPNSKAHDNCAEWMVNKFKGYGWEVSERKGTKTAHDGKDLKFNNITARWNLKAKKRILLTAHWDTRPWADNGTERTNEPIDGANDGASGVGVLIELARVLATDSQNIGVDIVLFDIEDYGVSEAANSFCYGSQIWFKDGGIQPRPMYGINLDMVGDPNATFYYEGHSANYARFVLDKVWAAAHRLGYQQHFKRDFHGEITDDHYYVNMVGIPCIDIIDLKTTGQTFPSTWHTHNDNMENISAPMLQKVGNTLLQVIYSEQ